eukprot:gene13707-16159_t
MEQTSKADDYITHILGMILDHTPADVLSFLKDTKVIGDGYFQRFFGDADMGDKRTLSWFNHFHYTGRNTHGSLALERFAFARRDQAWPLLVWRRRPVAPPIAAAKREMLLELDIVETMHNILAASNQLQSVFWNEYFPASLADPGALFAVDRHHFMSRLETLVLGTTDNNDISRINTMLDSTLSHRPLTFATLSHLGDQEILSFSNQLVRDTAIDSMTGRLHSAPSPDLISTLVSSLVISTSYWSTFQELAVANSLCPRNLGSIVHPLIQGN